MKRISVVLMAFAAVLAFSAVAVSSASAGVLFETEEGSTFPVAYSGVSKEVAKLETTNGSKIECTETEAKGEIGNMGAEVETKFAHLFLAVIIFKGCKNTILGGGNCENRGSGTKEIEVKSFIGHLGLTHSPASTEIPAVLLLPTLVEFECTVLGVKGKVKVTGNVIGEIVNPEIGKFKNTLTLSFQKEAGKAGVQQYKLFLLQLVLESESVMENEHLTTEALGKIEESSQEAKITLTSTKNLALVKI